jgi:hypothetical protein
MFDKFYFSIFDKAEEKRNDFFRKIRNNVSYRQPKINRDCFYINYPNEKGFKCKQKLIALPLAFWSVVVKIIYHVCKGIFLTMTCEFMDKNRYLIAHGFHVLRDVHESYGYVMSIFNEKYGNFIIQKCQFHRDCYNMFIAYTTLIVQTKLALSKNQKNIKLSALSKEVIASIFPRLKSKSDPEEAIQKEWFSNFTSEDVMTAIKKRLLSNHHARLISKQQINGINLSELKSLQLSFPKDDYYRSILFNNLEVSQVQTLLNDPDLRLNL